MKSQPTLHTDRLLLRAFTLLDAIEVQRMVAEKVFSDMIADLPHPYKGDMAEEWISTHVSKWQSGSELIYAVCDNSSAELLGSVGLIFNPAHHRAALGYWVGREHWRQGYCTEAATALIDFAFSELEVNRVEAIHIKKNRASGAVMKKLGMRHEGTLHGYLCNDGEFQDVEIYAVLAAHLCV